MSDSGLMSWVFSSFHFFLHMPLQQQQLLLPPPLLTFVIIKVENYHLLNVVCWRNECQPQLSKKKSNFTIHLVLFYSPDENFRACYCKGWPREAAKEAACKLRHVSAASFRADGPFKTAAPSARHISSAPVLINKRRRRPSWYRQTLGRGGS